MATRIGIDTGGTFTDVVRWSKKGLLVHKLPSTPDDPGRAVLAGIAAVRPSPDAEVDVVHGTTVGLNAVLQGRLPRTVFATNRGFVDLIEIGRQERTDLYALEPDRPTPPVSRELRVEVDCRRGPSGEALVGLTTREIERVVARIRRLRPEAIAIGFLHAPTAPADERRLARALRSAMPEVAVTCSADLWPGLGEYERFSAAILNAATAPLVADYTGRIAERLGRGRLRLLRSSTGILPTDEAKRFPARAMFSGPAGGVLASQRLCASEGLARAAAFDMGGTSTDVSLVQEGGAIVDGGSIAGLPLPLPSVDVHTVGCGGGSIAYRDEGGALRVGPRSAGAVPGPACYGVGDEPTVTDAHVALGHLGETTLLGGGFRIDPDRSVKALERLARSLRLSVQRTAEGILAVADVAMARALLRITGERAVDPAEVPLIAYGGAGGLHAAALCRRLGMPMAFVPVHPGAFSAVGLCLSGESVEVAEANLEEWTDATERRARARLRELLADAAARLPTRAHRRSASLVLRYRGQGGGLSVPLGRGSLAEAFAAAHHRRFGFVPERGAIEIVRLVARAETRPLALPSAEFAATRLPKPFVRRSPVGKREVRCVRRAELPLGSRLRGPLVIEETTAATLLPAGWSALVTPFALKVSTTRS